MKLVEYQGKELFQKYGIAVPRSVLVDQPIDDVALQFPLVLKSQVVSGDRKMKGGIVFIENKEALFGELSKLFLQKIDGNLPKKILIEERVDSARELYMSFSYDTDRRVPVCAFSETGGSGVSSARIFPLEFKDSTWTLPYNEFPAGVKKVAQSLLDVFINERALLVEVNPLFELKDGEVIAGDAKVLLDDAIVDPKMRPFLDLGGDIAILASGGGASLVNLDALMKHGGRPANYTEYSGNPPAAVVEELIIKVLSRPGLKGCWVIGGTANFTDIYETMLGFVQGLRNIHPQPTYPIVIRRDGPRRKEAFDMLREVKKNEGYDFHLYGPEIPMSESAKIMVERAYGHSGH